MDETIISINGANIFSLALMIVIIFGVFHFVMMGAAKMRAGSDA